MNFVAIILGIVVVFLLYYLYTTYYTSSTKLSTYVDLKVTNPVIPNTSLANSKSTRYSYGLWVYINSWDSSYSKTLISRMNTKNNNRTDFRLIIDKTTPTLRYKIGNQDTTVNASSNMITNNFPIQKWTYVIVSVDNQIIDTYLDGKLVSSTKLTYVPIVSQGDINIGQGNPQDIYLASINFWPTPMDPQTAWNYYLQGNGLSNISSGTNIQLSLLQNNITQKTFSLY